MDCTLRPPVGVTDESAGELGGVAVAGVFRSGIVLGNQNQYRGLDRDASSRFRSGWTATAMMTTAARSCREAACASSAGPSRETDHPDALRVDAG
ncbi:MAG: hypothetical protein CM1200mP20_13340 [Pseudomonadota bacterium]|nr:MAG: hypothetical protein CM1200mP20_13340 [Pseudomonadota bacterium]